MDRTLGNTTLAHQAGRTAETHLSLQMPAGARSTWPPCLLRLRRTLRALALCLGISATCLTTQAATPTPQSVKQLLEVAGAQVLAEQSLETAEQMVLQEVQQELGGLALTADQQRRIDLAWTKYAAVMKSELSWSTLEPLLVPIYREAFDQEEVDALIAFHQTPAGKSYVSKMPMILKRTAQVMDSHMQVVYAKLKKATDEVFQEAKLLPKI